MAIFLEVRCERRGDGRSPYGDFRCWSDDNNGPAMLACDDHASVSKVLTELNQDCIKAGWKKFRGEGWVCPACQEYEKQQGGE